MKKNNKKGFVLAEVIITSVVVISALTIIYTQFISVNNSYYRSFRYNTVDDIYALNNVRSFIENDSLNNLINKLDKEYLDLSDCSYEYVLEYNYCQKLLDTLNIKKLIFTHEDLTNLKQTLNQDNNLSEGMKSFIKTISTNKNNKYRLIAEFENDRYATLKIGSFIVSNISDDCVRYGNTCSIDQIKNQVSLTFSVNDNESYKFNVLNDDGEKLTLIMDNYFENNIKWSDSIVNGPVDVLNYIDTKTKKWVNVLDITYTLNGSTNDDYTSCETYSECNKNVYEMSTINSKTRLPKLQELANLGCTDIAGSCPAWLTANLNTTDTTGFWTSTTTSDKAWIISFDNRLNNVNIDNDKIKIKPVIIIDKSAI